MPQPTASLHAPSEILFAKLTGQFPYTVVTVYYSIYLEEVRINTEELSQDLVSEPEFKLAPLKYEARVVLTSKHNML
jgi:hypothetical protein